jgi:hypothetical protein
MDCLQHTNPLPHYDPAEAAAVSYRNLPPDVKARLSPADVERILDLELEYQEKVGLVGDSPSADGEEATLDYAEMVDFIRGEGRQRQLLLSPDAIEAVLDAEQVYLGQIGAIEY